MSPHGTRWRQRVSAEGATCCRGPCQAGFLSLCVAEGETEARAFHPPPPNPGQGSRGSRGRSWSRFCTTGDQGYAKRGRLPEAPSGQATRWWPCHARVGAFRGFSIITVPPPCLSPAGDGAWLRHARPRQPPLGPGPLVPHIQRACAFCCDHVGVTRSHHASPRRAPHKGLDPRLTVFQRLLTLPPAPSQRPWRSDAGGRD